MKILFGLLLLALVACSPRLVPSNRVYLGKTVEDSLEKQSFEVVRNNYIHINSLPYRTLKHELADSKIINERTTIRQGIILTGKSKNHYSENRVAQITNSLDTLTIFYSYSIFEKKHGRSATASVKNLLSKKSKKNPQKAPVTWLEGMELRGVMILHGDTFRFKYEGEGIDDSVFYTYQLKAGGYLRISNTALNVFPVTSQINERKNVRPVNSRLRNGFVLQDDERVVGAVDLISSPGAIYFAKTLDKDDKLLVAGFLFIATTNL